MRAGSDEAGKGPVLGSMFAAVVAVDGPGGLPEDVADSKDVRPERRQEIAEALDTDDQIAVGVAEITVEEIDAPETDMNTLTVQAHARAIDDAVTHPEAAETLHVLADAGDTSEERFARRVTDECDAVVEVTAEHGADEDDPLVGAASIVAKVRRDEHIAALNGEYDREIGSGYPGDPMTREFLAAYAEEHGDVPPCARRSWSTVEDVLAATEQAGLSEF